MKDIDKAYLAIAKNYINYLDIDGYDVLNADIEDIDDESLIEAHHQIVADILRYINKNILKDEDKTLKWMQENLNKETYNNFYGMTFEEFSINN